MKSFKQSIFGLAISFAILTSVSAQASSMLFLCEHMFAPNEMKASRQTEKVLAFFLGDDEIADLDHVIRAYQEFTRQEPRARGDYEGLFEDVVALVYIGQGPYVEFENTIGKLHENKHLLESLLSDSKVYAELRRQHPAKTLHLRESIRPVLPRPVYR